MRGWRPGHSTSDGKGFYTEDDDQIGQVEAACKQRYGHIVSRPGWMRTMFGNGVDIARHATNIVFSDGEKDPWRVGGVPSNASAYSPDGSVVHILIEDAAHHQDLRSDHAGNPPSVRKAKDLERAHIHKWLGVSV